MSMFEQLKKAIDDAGLKWLEGKPLEGWADVPTEIFVEAVLETLKVPSPEMIEAGCYAREPKRSLEENTLSTWTLMIEAAKS